MKKFSYNISEQTIVNWYIQAMQGDAEAQYYVGMYESLYNDFRYGAEGHWYAAAKKGLAKAQFRIGNCGQARIRKGSKGIGTVSTTMMVL